MYMYQTRPEFFEQVNNLNKNIQYNPGTHGPLAIDQKTT